MTHLNPAHSHSYVVRLIYLKIYKIMYVINNLINTILCILIICDNMVIIILLNVTSEGAPIKVKFEDNKKIGRAFIFWSTKFQLMASWWSKFLLCLTTVKDTLAIWIIYSYGEVNRMVKSRENKRREGQIIKS